LAISFLLPLEVVNERTGFRLEKSYVALHASQFSAFHAIFLRVSREWGNDPIHTVAINIHPIPPFAHFLLSTTKSGSPASPAVGSQEKESLHQQLNETIQKLEAAEALADQWAYWAYPLPRKSVIKHGWEIINGCQR